MRKRKTTVKNYVREYAEDKIKSLEEAYAMWRNESAKKVIDEIKWVLACYEKGMLCAEEAVRCICNAEERAGVEL